MASLPSFQAFTLKASGTIDCIVSDIEVLPGFDPNNPPNPLPTATQTKALWDTGASKSVVSSTFAQSLGLKPVGMREVHHGDGKSMRSTFMVNFNLPNSVHVAGIIATEFPASHNNFSVIVGMDVITLGDFSLTHVGGKTVMSFRIPSCEQIDYVMQANRIKFAGTSRNALCPCGSGKKFKLCHISAIQP